MRSFITVLFSSALLLVVLGACADNAATQQVRSAASVDMGCHESSIEFVQDAPLEKTVRGCGQELTYMRQCGGRATGSCRWQAFRVDNSKPSTPAPTGPTGKARLSGTAAASTEVAAETQADAGTAAPAGEQDPDSLD